MKGKDIIGEPYTGHLYHNIRMNSELRGYMYNMPSHNTVLAYGKPIAPNEVYANKWGVYRPDSPIISSHSEKDGFYASAYHDGYTFCRHTREVLFHREQGLIISDHIMRGNRMDTPHIQRFNLMQGTSVAAVGEHFVIVEKEGTRLLFVWSGAEHHIAVNLAELLVPEIVATKEELFPILDVSFQASKADQNKNVTVTLNLLILDVTNWSGELSTSQIEHLQRQLELLCKDLSNPKALKSFPAL